MVYLPNGLLDTAERNKFSNSAAGMIDSFVKQYSGGGDSSQDDSSSPDASSAGATAPDSSQPVQTVSQMDQASAPPPSAMADASSASSATSAPDSSQPQQTAMASTGSVEAQPSTTTADVSAPQPTKKNGSWLPSIEDLTSGWGVTPSSSSNTSASTDGSTDQAQPTKKNGSWLPTLDDMTRDWAPFMAPKPADASGTTAAGGSATRLSPLTPTGTPSSMPSATDRTNPQLANGQRANVSMASGPITGDDRISRITSAAPIAQQVEAKTGMPADVNLAFAVHESGLDPQYAPGMSYHGRHAVGDEDGTPIVDWGYDAQGNRVDYPTKLKSYTTPSGSFEDFAHLITTSPIYADAWNAYKQTGDKAQLVKDIWASGYGESKQGPGETVDIMQGQVQPAVAAAKQAPASVTVDQTPKPAGPQGVADGPGWRKTWGDNLTPDQIKSTLAEGMDWDSAIATCGVAAAVAFARANGGDPPTFGQALRLAQGSGEWNSDVGMVHGASGEIALLHQMNVDAHAAPVNEQQVAQAVQAGQPVQINATGGGGHFYVAQDYDPQTGRFNFGNSASILKASGGRTWFRIDELPALGVGTPSTAIYLGAGQ